MSAGEQRSVMRVIRNDATGHYYAGDGKWFKQIERAKNFQNLAELVMESTKHEIKNCSVILKFSNPAFDVRIPFGSGSEKRI